MKAYPHSSSEPAAGGIDSVVVSPVFSTTRFSPSPPLGGLWLLRVEPGEGSRAIGKVLFTPCCYELVLEHPGLGGMLKLTFSVTDLFWGLFLSPISGNLSSAISFLQENLFYLVAWISRIATLVLYRSQTS